MDNIFDEISEAKEFNENANNNSLLAQKVIEEIKIDKKKYYRKLYLKCIKNILCESKKNKKEYLYEIPNIVPECSYYNKLDYTYYMMNALRMDGFFVSYINSGFILIRFTNIDEEMEIY